MLETQFGKLGLETSLRSDRDTSWRVCEVPVMRGFVGRREQRETGRLNEEKEKLQTRFSNCSYL